ncbi:hypothetical protein HDU97_008192 [Phlyctochytrium planicorne]|nr:hypothetical protein HDU97_008192 [Phlyctochytrium planicorne]
MIIHDQQQQQQPQHQSATPSSASSCEICTALNTDCDGLTPGCTGSPSTPGSEGQLVKRHRKPSQTSPFAAAGINKHGGTSPTKNRFASVSPGLNQALLKIITQRSPNITFRDPFHPLSMYLDQINISFALEDHVLKWKHKIKRAFEFEEAKRSSTETEIWAERMMIEGYFRWQKSCCFEVVHRKTFLDELDNQPPMLRFAMAALAGQLSVPQAPHVLIRSYFEKALSMVPDVIEDCSVENIQACVLVSVVATALGDTVAAHRMLDLAARTAEYMQLYIDPDDFVELKVLPWTEREVRRRIWWSIFFLDKMAVIMFGRPSLISESRRITSTVQPSCDNDIFTSLELDAASINDPPPMVSTDTNQLVRLLEIGEKVQAVLGSRIFQTLEELEEVMPNVISLESELMLWFDRLPPALAQHPSELDIHRTFLPDDASFDKMLSNYKVQRCAVLLPVNTEKTKKGRSTAWDQLLLHAMHNALVCLLHRPRLLLYTGNYRMPAPKSIEERLLLRAVEKVEKSAGSIVGITDHIVRAGVAFSRDPAQLVLGSSPLSSYEMCFQNLIKTQHAFKRASNLAAEAGKMPFLNFPGADNVEPPRVSAIPRIANSQKAYMKAPEVHTHSFMRFPLLVGSMLLADLAALQRRLDPHSDLVKVYYLPCYIGISLMSRLMTSIAFFWNVGEDYLGTMKGLLDAVVKMAKVEKIDDLDEFWQSDFAKNVFSGRYTTESL